MKVSNASTETTLRHSTAASQGDRAPTSASSLGLRMTDTGGTTVYPVRVINVIGGNVVDLNNAEINLILNGTGSAQPNDSGGTLAYGAVVVLDDDGDWITTTTAQDIRPVGIVTRSTSDGFNAPAQTQGFVPQVNTTGTVNAGDFLETSTSAGLAISSGIQRRVGTFAQATSDGPNPSAYLFGMPDPITSSGSGGSGGILSIVEDFLSSDVVLATTLYGQDGPSLALGAGTYLLIWRALYIVSGTTSVYVVIWDSGETTKYDEAEDSGSTSGYRYGMGGTGIAVLGTATTIKMSFNRSSDAAASMLTDGGNSTDGGMTKLLAVRLA